MKPYHLSMLEQIRMELHSTPELAAYITDAMTRGLQESIRLQIERAADMEVVASMALHNRLFKGNELFIAQKLRKWQGQTSVRWDDALKKLEEQK